VVNVQEFAQRLPAIFDVVLQQVVLRDQRTNVLVVSVVPFSGVVGEITIEEDLPATLEGWPSPAAVHA
jgi:hypothetical protein